MQVQFNHTKTKSTVFCLCNYAIFLTVICMCICAVWFLLALGLPMRLHVMVAEKPAETQTSLTS